MSPRPKKHAAIDGSRDDFDFYSPREELTRRGIYYLTGEIDQDNLLEVHQDILLKHMDPHWEDDIQIIVNSGGGSVTEGWALIDLLEWVRMDIRTTAIGICASMGTMIACCGTKGKRVVAPNTSIMIHGATWAAFGSKSDIATISKEMEREHKRDVNFWITHSKYNTKKEIEKNFLHGKNDEWFNAQDALDHGIFDSIVGQETIEKKNN